MRGRKICDTRQIHNVGSTPELYDEQADPGEFVNLTGRAGLKKIEDGLRRRVFDAVGGKVPGGVSPSVSGIKTGGRR